MGNNSQSPNTGATFSQNNKKLVNLDDFDIENNNNETNNDNIEENKSPANKKPDKSTLKEVNVTNESCNNCRGKNVNGTKKEPELAEKSNKKDTREANDRKKSKRTIL